MTLDEVEEAMIAKCLRHYGGNVSRAAEALGMSRPALYRRIVRIRSAIGAVGRGCNSTSVAEFARSPDRREELRGRREPLGGFRCRRSMNFRLDHFEDGP
jgi:transposase-like protein